ncbi:MAG: AAA family ATPase [Anaerolineae bacterium]|nr:AAA family ATPase [Anaerolineae bacterium]
MQPLNSDALTTREIEVLQLFEQGLTNREIGDKLYLTVGTVKWYAQQIFNKLGVSNRGDAVQVAQTLGLLQPERPVASNIPNNLPAEISAFIGRQQELNQIRLLLAQSRLITLTGPAGAGKTRLALRVGQSVLQEFPDGVSFIDLAHVQQTKDVIPEIALHLGIQDAAQESSLSVLQTILARRTCLLILDNFEKLIEAALHLVQLLAGAPGLKILVTSREALHLNGEQLFPVPPLALPNENDPLERLLSTDAVTLFVRRAQAIRPDFSLTEENASDVAALCRRLDGLPLAIELAAARIRVFSPAAILDRLAQSNAILSSGTRDAVERHRTLYDAISWSYDLLTDEEKHLLCQLSVFRDGVSIDAIDAVCDTFSPIDLMNTLNSLVDKSLIQQYDDVVGETRFRLLVTIREYALERLPELEAADVLREKHARFFLMLAERRDVDDRVWLNLMHQENENLRLAFDWLLISDKCSEVIRLANALFRHWLRRMPAEGLTRITAIFEPCQDAARNNSDLNYHSARLAFNIGATDLGRTHVEQLTRNALASGDRRHLGRAAALEAIYLVSEQSPDVLWQKFSRALEHYEAAEDKVGIGWMIGSLGVIRMVEGKYEEALALLEQSHRTLVQAGETWLAAGALINLGLVNLYRKELDTAKPQMIEAARLQWQVGTHDGLANVLVGLASVACAEQQFSEAARLLVIVDLILERYNLRLDYPERDLYQEAQTSASQHCDDKQLSGLRQQVKNQSLSAILEELGIM